MQLCWTRRSEELVPGTGTESGDAGQAGFDIAKLDCANQAGETGTELANTCVSILVLADTQHQKDRRPRQRANYILGKNNFIQLAGSIHCVDLDLGALRVSHLCCGRSV